MAKIPLDPQGQGQEFQLRPGIPPFSGSGWRGVNTEADPASLEANELQRAENVRLQGKSILTRQGLIQKIDLSIYAPWSGGGASAGSAATGFKEAPVDNPRVRLWASALGCFGSTITTGGRLLHVDPSESPAVQTYSNFFATADRQPALGRYGDRLYVGDKSAFREVLQITPMSGTATSSMFASPSTVPIHTFTGYTIRCMQEFDGKLFISLEDDVTIAASKIAVWDGLSITDDKTGIRPAVAFGLFQDKLVAGFDATAGNIQVRPAGAPGATWTAYALAGFACGTQGNVMQEVRDKLYIAGGNTDLYVFDGAAVTVARNIATADAAGNGITSVCLHHGLLYYGWNTATPNYLARIGRHDPDSTAANEWVDTYKDITTDQANFKLVSTIRSYRQQIFCGGRQLWIVATAINNVKGTIEVINNTGAPSAGFTVLGFARFP